MRRSPLTTALSLCAPAALAAAGLDQRAAPSSPPTAPAAVRATAPATKPAVAFLDGEAAADAFVDDRMEPYFAKLAAHEMTAKTGRPITGDTPDARRQECVRRYRAGVRPFADDERAALAAGVDRLRPAVARVAPRLAAVPWTFIKVANEIEFGFPHTRGGCIVLPERVARQMAAAAASPPVSTLAHEFAHVAQRADPATWATLYEGVWHLRRVKSIEPNDWLAARQLLNPDGVVCDWVLPVGEADGRRWVLPLIAFREPGGRVAGGSGINLIAVDLEPAGAGERAFRAKAGEGGVPVAKPLAAEAAYAAAFGRGGNSYHPNEVAADLFASAVAEELAAGGGGGDGQPPRRAGQRAGNAERLAAFRAWANGALAEPAARPAD